MGGDCPGRTWALPHATLDALRSGISCGEDLKMPLKGHVYGIAPRMGLEIVTSSG